MFYLTTHSTHFIYGYMASDMVKDHSDSEKGNPLPPHKLLLSINSKGSFNMHHPADRITHTTAFVTPIRGALAGTRNSSMGSPHEESIAHKSRERRLWCVLSCLWDGAYKRFLAVNQRVAHVVTAVGFLSHYLSDPLPYV